MKFKQRKRNNTTLSEKIANALTVKPRADIEDDEVFGTKPHTVSRGDFSSSDSEDDKAVSDFRKRSVNLLSEISKKYEGKVISRKELVEESDVSSSSQHSGSRVALGNVDFSEDSDASETRKKFKELTRPTDLSISENEDPDEDTKGIDKLKSTFSQTSLDFDLNSEVEEDSDENGEESDDYSINQFKKQLLNNDESEDEDTGEDEEDGSGDDEKEGEGYDISQIEEPLKEDFEHVKKQNVSEEAKKGACVRNQLHVWEGLLEMRIHLQRCMNTANQMPMPDIYEKLKQSNQFNEECKNTKTTISNALDKFLTLQNLLLKKFPETKTLSIAHKPLENKEDTKEESDEEIPSDTDNEEIPSDTEDEETVVIDKKSPKKNVTEVTSKKRKLEDYEKEIATSHKALKSFRDSTIQKWNEKTRLATATNVKNAPTNTILQQISYILSDRQKLLRRTQLKRSEYDIVGYIKPTEDDNKDLNVDVNLVTRDRKDDDEYIPEIFDDSDFYHQLLRELIECKSADISDPVQLSRQWIALQQMRSKMKRKVDTKATKGRKIKYVVHNQLVNYLAPEKSTTWNEESTNELYSSLFGKMFEQNNVGINNNLSNVFKIKG